MADREELDALRRMAELEAKAAPPPEPKGAYRKGMEAVGSAALRGLQGGIPGAIASGAAEGMTQAGHILDRAAYDAGGAITDAAAKVLPTERPTNPMLAMVPTAQDVGFAANVGLQTAPTLLGGESAKLATGLLDSGARTLMQSALKPNSLARQGGATSDAAKAIQTMFDEGIIVSQGGIAKARELVDKLQSQVAQKIQAAAQAGATVDKGYVGSEIYKTLQKFRKQLNPGADEAAILKSWAETNAKLQAKIPVLEAQELKQGTYRVLADKYAKGGTPAVENEAATQAQMAGARGLRQGLEDAVPGVGAINKRESAIINAIEQAEGRAGTAGNRDIGGIAWLANHPAAATAMMADRSPAFKSWLAQQIYKYKSSGPQNAARGVIGAYESEVGSSPRYEIQQ